MSEKKPLYNNVLITGCGDIGRRVAATWRTENIPMSGIVTSEHSASMLQQQGITAYQRDFNNSGQDLPTLSQNTLIYYFVPPPASGQYDLRCKQFLSALSAQAASVRRIVAISTTGVYGDCGGARVTEEQPPAPGVDRARRRLDMEHQLQAWTNQHNTELIILRVGGIYGPGRLPLQRIRDRVPVLHEVLAPMTNRIHADDLAMICKAAALVDRKSRIYNVSDGTQSNMTEYFYTLADYFNLPRPPAVDWAEAEATLSRGMLSYLRESRQVDNSRMLKELNIVLRYPTLLAGLPSCEGGTEVRS